MMEPWQGLSLAQKIAQMIVVRTSGRLFDHELAYPAWEASLETLKSYVDLGVGGVILLGGSAAEVALKTAMLQEQAKIPLLICADIEEGVGQRFSGGTWFPPPMALGAIAQRNPELAQEYARQYGQILAREAQAIGINWLLGPVADINNNPQNPVINVRAFGETAATVGDLITAFLQGAQTQPVLTTAKHFPGHGDTATDSHLCLPTIPHGDHHLRSQELRPFQRAIAAGVDTIMTAHLAIPAWDDTYPATLSPRILGQILRTELGFEGLIVTDALIMGGITQFGTVGEIAVAAVQAGADILLMPAHPHQAIAAITAAVAQGDLAESDIDQAVARIHRAKSKLQPTPMAKGDRLTRQLHLPEAVHLSRDILEKSQTITGQGPIAPVANAQGKNLLVVDRTLQADFLRHHCPAIALPQTAGFTPELWEQKNLLAYPHLDCPTLVQVFLRGNPFQAQSQLTPHLKTLCQTLETRHQLQGIIFYGSPYLAEALRHALPDRLPILFTYGQMPQTQAIACGTLLDLSGNPDFKDTLFT